MSSSTKKINKKIVLMIIDVLISFFSVFIASNLIGTVGEETNSKLIFMALLYLPVCVLFPMIMVRGYEFSLKTAEITRYIKYVKAFLIGSVLYISVDIIMGYTIYIVLKLFSIVLAYSMMMFVRIIYCIIMNNLRIADEKRIKLMVNEEVDFASLITENAYKQVEIDDEEAMKFLQKKKVLITGAGGTIGSKLFERLVDLKADTIIGLDIYENSLYELEDRVNEETVDSKLYYEVASIRDYNKMDQIFAKYRPDIVYHAAAHKHVSVMEKNPEEAVKNNVFGTYNCTKLADQYNVEKFVLISSDKAHKPISIMGATKRISEMILQYMASKSRKTQFMALRFCNVIGSNASVIALMDKKIKKGEDIKITDKNATRFFISSTDAVNFVVKMTMNSENNEIYVLDVDKAINIKELAYRLIKEHGYKPNSEVKIKYTGLRLGERLHEELVPKDAMLFKDNIYIIEQTKLNNRTFRRNLDLLNAAAKEHDEDNIRKIIGEIVVDYNYKPRKKGDNNIYETYGFRMTNDEFNSEEAIG